MTPRFEAKWTPEPNSGCWLWTASCTLGGYGKFTVNYKTVLAHRWAYEQEHGPIPKGMHIDHLCRVRSCVNPAHMELVTPRENLRRSDLVLSTQNSAKTHCPKGHAYDEENTYWKGARRVCRRCGREKERARYRERQAMLGRTIKHRRSRYDGE